MTAFVRLRTAAALAVAGVGLSACADLGIAPPQWPWQQPRPTVSAPQPEQAAPPPRAAKATVVRPAAKPDKKAATAKPAPEAEAREAPKLVGLSEVETARLLGQPAEETAQPPGKVWVYKAAGCRLAVHLFPDMDRGGFYTLDTTAEEGSRDACVGKLADDARKKE